MLLGRLNFIAIYAQVLPLKEFHKRYILWNSFEQMT